MENAKQKGITDSFLDRLYLDEDRILSISNGLRSIVELSDPVGEEIGRWKRPNGLDISRVRTPLGVIGVIYESRPNVTADAGALCLKAGNAVILRGGSESFHSSNSIHKFLVQGLVNADLPKHSIQIIPTTDREAVGHLLEGLNGNIDVIVPSGGKSLVERVQNEAKDTCFWSFERNMSLYVDKDADISKAKDILINAKMRRPGICGAAETLLIDKNSDQSFLPLLLNALKDSGCEVRGCQETMESNQNIILANDEDWSTEYLEAIISVKVVNGVEGAISHISEYSTNHTDSIITENTNIAEKFMREVDSAIVMHNASTQFADGGEFGMGAEIGIATGRFHARGPVGVEQLTSFKYVVRGSGKQDHSDDILVHNDILPIKPKSKIGLFGGSFNPAHEWHFQVAKNALNELKLNKVIWLVSASNPLKKTEDLLDFHERFLSAKEIAISDDFFVSDFEKIYETKYSIETISKIMELYPDVSFVWIMGSDCAAEISQWKDWEKFINLIPIAIYPRPSFEIESDKLDLIKNNAKQIDLSSQENFSICKPPVITFIPGPMSDISSSQIRKVKDV